MSAMKTSKRPLRSLTAHEKLDAIRRVHDGESKASVARDIGVPESTLRGWCKNESKISYLSRQSSPDTDESLEPKDKKIKLDNDPQPFNLSLKAPTGMPNYSPNSENRFKDADLAKTPLNLNIKTDLGGKSHSMSEREKNRAELARLSVELGLNRPEMFQSSAPTNMAPTNNLADLTANIGLLAQWNNLLMQQAKLQTGKKVTSAPADTSSSNMISSSSGAGLLTPVKPQPNPYDKSPSLGSGLKLPKEKQQSAEDMVWYWLKQQQTLLSMQNPAVTASLPTSTTTNICNANNYMSMASSAATTPITSLVNTTSPLSGATPDQSSWFWKWYKQFTYGQIAQIPPSPEKPILYQQLMKEKDDIPVDDKKMNSNKARAVLDNLLFNNNNNVAVNQRDGKEDDETLSQTEALEHGEKFLKWLETCSEPSVTAMQIMQFRTMLTNIKTGADRKNGDLQNKTKVKRK